MADVYEGVDVRTGQAVAVKVLRSVLADDLRRFERELDALEALDHPAVVALRGHGVHDGHPFLVLERCDGGCLATVLADGPLGPDRAAELGAVLAEGLAHAHARGVVHRDVKPANVLLVEGGTPKLADFGIARLRDSSALTGTGFTIGTAAYLAPEQAKGGTIGPEADVYSLGLVVLEAATGTRAFDGVGLAAAIARLQHPPDIPESLPPDLAATVGAMTAMDPADRPTAAEVSAALRPHATADPDAGATAVLPILDEPTTVIPAVVAAAPRVWPRWTVPAACFVAGFLAVLFIGIALAGGGGDGVRPTTTTTPVPTTIATTAVATTAPPPPPRDDAEERGNGNGNGRGGGRGNGNDD
jgi:serine/threonine protein kinase